VLARCANDREDVRPLRNRADDDDCIVARALRLAAGMRSDRLRPSASVRASRSKDGLVLLDVEGGALLAANAIGADIWRLIEEGCAADEIAHRIAAEYDVDIDRATRDVDAFLSALAARRLVTGGSR
jgi:hypothetical protein